MKYIQEQPDCEIRKDCILAINPKAKTQSSIVQLADYVCGAIQNAIEHKYGVIEDSYLLELKDKLYRRDGKVFGHGIKIMPYASGSILQVLSPVYKWLNNI